MGAPGDSVHTDYGWVADSPEHAVAYLRPVVIRELSHHSVNRILDLGAGKGALCSALVALGYDVVGIDIDEGGMQIARATVPGATFYTRSVEDGPGTLMRSEDPFDAVVSTEVVEHLYAPATLPVFAHAALKPGGVLIVTTPYHGWLKNVAISATGKWDRHHTVHWDGGHIKFWSRRTLTELLEKNGFEVVSFVGIGRLPFLWKSMMLIARRRGDD